MRWNYVKGVVVEVSFASSDGAGVVVDQGGVVMRGVELWGRGGSVAYAGWCLYLFLYYILKAQGLDSELPLTMYRPRS